MEKIKNIFLYGKLPFIVLLEDSLGERLNTLPEKGIEIVSPDDEFKCMLFFKKQMSSNMAIEDINGELNYSRFCLAYCYQNTKKRSLNEYFCDDNGYLDYDLLIDISKEIINKFITIYKSTYHQRENSKDWIPIITNSKLSPWKVVVLDFNDKRIAEPIIDYRGTGIGIGSDMPIEQRDELKHLCMSHFDIDYAGWFFQESNRYKQTGDYTSFCIFICSALEKWVFREVKYKLQQNGKTDTEIETMFKNNGKWIYHEEAIKLITGDKNFVNTNEYKNYRDNVAEKRNEIIHRTFVRITKKEAEEIILDTMKYRDLLLKLVWNK